MSAGSGAAAPKLPAALEALRVKVVEAERKLAGKQVTWASTPAEVPTLRAHGPLASGIVDSRKQYAFKCEHDREQFVYDRNDTLFTVSRDIRAVLGLSPVTGGGTFTPSGQPLQQAAPAPAKKKRGTSTPPAPPVAKEVAPPAPVVAVEAQQPRKNKYRK